MLPEDRSGRKGAKSNSHVENLKSPRGREKILRTYHLILPKYHLILPKNFSFPPEEIEISSGTIWEIPRREIRINRSDRKCQTNMSVDCTMLD